MFFVEDIKLGNKHCPKSHSQEVAYYRFQFGPGALSPRALIHTTTYNHIPSSLRTRVSMPVTRPANIEELQVSDLKVPVSRPQFPYL